MEILGESDVVLKENCKSPGIMTTLMEAIALKTQNSFQTPFKLSLDLKKLNAGGKFGDVNCWGHENKPNLEDRLARFNSEKSSIQVLINKIDSNNFEKISAMNEFGKDVGDIVKNLSGGMQNLRELNTKRVYAFDKLKQESGPNWKESKMAYALSSIQTSMHEIQSTMTDLSLTIKDLLKIGAMSQGFVFPLNNSIHMDSLSNYVCLAGMDQTMIDDGNLPLHVYSRFIKQRSKIWFDVRSKAQVTGSTIYKAIGLETLKEQQQFYDEKFRGKHKPITSEEVQERMRHGVENEINGIATLVSVVLPTFYPKLHFHEEGCYVVHHNREPFCVVSPDGSLRNNGTPEMAVEIKCPHPDGFLKGPYRTLPERYALQVLMEMYALKVTKAVIVCWMPKATTVLEVSFSHSLWKKTWNILLDLYAQEVPKRPSRLHPLLKDLKKEIKEFTDSCSTLLCEVVSVTGKACSHPNVNIHDVNDLYLYHTEAKQSSTVFDKDHIQSVLSKSHLCLNRSYNLMRDIAKQVLVVMFSDCNRMYKTELPHSCPIAYGLTGYSFTTQQASNILRDVRGKCLEYGLHVVAECFDGAFYKLAVRGENNEPLTLLQLSKDVWMSACSLSKQELVQKFACFGRIPGVQSLDDIKNNFHIHIEQSSHQKIKSISIGFPLGIKSSYKTPLNWRDLLILKEKQSESLDTATELIETVATAVFQVNGVQEPVLDTSEVMDTFIDNLPLGTSIATDRDNETQSIQASSGDSHITNKGNLDEYDFHSMWKNFIEMPKRNDCVKETFINFLSNAETMNRLTKAEIMHILKPVKEKLKVHIICKIGSMKKYELINRFIGSFGDGSSLVLKTRQNAKPLRAIVKAFIYSNLPKQFLNAVQASFKYEVELQKWNEKAAFTKDCKVSSLDDNETHLDPPFWYCQPKFIEEDSNYILDFLDPEHLLTNTRSKVCSTGFPSAGISPKAWLKTAKFSKDNGSNLSLALVENLVDKQNVGFAMKTFSSEVESAMDSYGYKKEAQFCGLMRNWYRAQDEGGLSCLDRRSYERDLREWLLNGVRFDVFPPPGKYVKDIPVTLFEGLMIHIDRRAQLYLFTGGAYNARSIGTLELENLFGAFQDWDAKGTGMLRAEEVSQSLYAACDLYKTRLDDDRGFNMHTSAARVYPIPPCVEKGVNISKLTNMPTTLEEIRCVKSIEMRDHAFDTPDRKTKRPKRKSGHISDTFNPSRGNKGVRAERYTLNEAKILPHIRAGIDLPNIIK